MIALVETPPMPCPGTSTIPRWAVPFMKPARFKSARGGRGSSKSHTFAQLAILRMAGLLPAYKPKAVRIASARQFQSSIKESIKQACEHYIHTLGLTDSFQIGSFEINHRTLGSRMFFPGFDRNPRSLMSVEGVDVLWVEQAETLSDEMELIEPSIRAPGSELWFTWNPNLRTDFCWKRFVQNPRPGDVSALVNYMDNPWFPPELEAKRLIDKEEEPDRYEHVWLGKPDDGDFDAQILPYVLLDKCVQAFKQGLAPPYESAPVIDAGLDIAEGGKDKCSTIVRVGPTIVFGDIFPGKVGDLSVAAERCNRALQHWDIWQLNYDGSAPMAREFQALEVPYAFRAVNFGGEVEGKKVNFERKRTNETVFRMLNVQMAFAVRLRALRTVKLMNGKEGVDPEACLFIDPNLFNVHREELPRNYNLDLFLSEMTQPIRRQSVITGKWEMDKRGGDEAAKSPDTFDATCLAFFRDCKRLRADRDTA